MSGVLDFNEATYIPAAPSAEPEQETPMATQVCAGGCGTEIPSTNKRGFVWGHKRGWPTPARRGPNRD